jgi:hypothetical protein
VNKSWRVGGAQAWRPICRMVRSNGVVAAPTPRFATTTEMRRRPPPALPRGVRRRPTSRSLHIASVANHRVVTHSPATIFGRCRVTQGEARPPGEMSRSVFEIAGVNPAPTKEPAMLTASERVRNQRKSRGFRRQSTGPPNGVDCGEAICSHCSNGRTWNGHERHGR